MTYDAPARSAAEIDDAPEGADGGVMGRALALVQRNLHIVGKLAEAGFSKARAIVEEWQSPPPRMSGREARHKMTFLTVSSARVNRGVRLAVLLRQRLLGDLKKLAKGSLADAERVLADRPIGSLAREVTLNLRLDEVLRTLNAILQKPSRPAASATAPTEAEAEDEAEAPPPAGHWEVIETIVHPPHRPEKREPTRTVDPLKAYVRSLPVSVILDEIVVEFDMALDTVAAMEMAYEQEKMEARLRAAAEAEGHLDGPELVDFPDPEEFYPLIGLPDRPHPAEGRARGLKRTAHRPPSSDPAPAPRRSSRRRTPSHP